MSESQELIERLCRFISVNSTGMTKEQDLINLCSGIDQLEQLIPEITHRFEQVGFSLVRSKFQGDRFYVLTTPGKDDRISPRMYGILGILIATFNELGPELEVKTVKELFHDMWGDIEQLIALNYLQYSPQGTTTNLIVTPIAKAALKNVLKSLELKNLFKVIGSETSGSN